MVSSVSKLSYWVQSSSEFQTPNSFTTFPPFPPKKNHRERLASSKRTQPTETSNVHQSAPRPPLNLGSSWATEIYSKEYTLEFFKIADIAPEKWWLEDYSPFGMVTFQGLTVKLLGVYEICKVWNLYTQYLEFPLIYHNLYKMDDCLNRWPITIL